VPLQRGSTVLVPDAAGPAVVTGDLDVIVAGPGIPREATIPADLSV
jgi:hypothetical protein